MKSFFIAVQFLTVFPVRIASPVKKTDYGPALTFFPVVGLLLGLFLSLCSVLSSFLPREVHAVLILTVSVVITGAIHLDGLADTCDGFYGQRSREDVLKIMRDSRIGVMGVTGVVIALLLKYALFINMPLEVLCPALMTAMTAGRWAHVFCCYYASYARQDGKAKYFMDYAGEREMIRASLFTVAVFLFLRQLEGLFVFFILAIIVFLFIRSSKHKIDGMTGDTIGAAGEIAEISVLLLTVILSSLGGPHV